MPTRIIRVDLADAAPVRAAAICDDGLIVVAVHEGLTPDEEAEAVAAILTPNERG